MTGDAIRATRELIATARGRLPRAARRWLLVDVAEQRVLLLEGVAVLREYPVSTAVAGLNGAADSGGTPPGLHVIGRKIGHDQPAGTVFANRRPTGAIWNHPQAAEKADPPAETEFPAQDTDLILSRILTLEGQEDGVNRGPGCDSRARYIYLHGTNHEDRIGEPASHGCIRLTNADVIDLFDRVQEGDPVVIV